MIRDLSNYDIGCVGEYNPDEGCDIPFCPVCGDEECSCPEEEE